MEEDMKRIEGEILESGINDVEEEHDYMTVQKLIMTIYCF
jgi:hypothetical protein